MALGSTTYAIAAGLALNALIFWFSTERCYVHYTSNLRIPAHDADFHLKDPFHESSEAFQKSSEPWSRAPLDQVKKQSSSLSLGSSSQSSEPSSLSLGSSSQSSKPSSLSLGSSSQSSKPSSLSSTSSSLPLGSSKLPLGSSSLSLNSSSLSSDSSSMSLDSSSLSSEFSSLSSDSSSTSSGSSSLTSDSSSLSLGSSSPSSDSSSLSLDSSSMPLESSSLSWEQPSNTPKATNASSEPPQEQVGPYGTSSLLQNDYVLHGLPRHTHLMVTFTNSHYTNFMHNWVKHVRQLALPFVVAAFDEEALHECQRAGYPAVYLPAGLNKSNFREDISGQFRQMGVVKAQAAKALLEAYDFSSVVLSDTDTVWLRDPGSLIEAHPDADLLTSTDCLSHKLEVDQVFQPTNYRCGHIPGSVTNVAFNTGILILRNTTGCINVLDNWIMEMSDKAKEVEGKNWQLDDQLEFNFLLERDMFPVQAASKQDPRLIWVFEHKARVYPIPVLQAANGHVMFLQQLPHRYGVVPYVVHTTFQRFDLVGKVARLRDMHAWLNDKPGYYSNGSFLSYTNHVQYIVQLLATEWKQKIGRPMTMFHKHLIAAGYQLHTLQDAVALARALNRTLILPPFHCYCYEDSVANVLDTCAMKGSDGPLPFQCPTDFLLNMNNLDKAFDYRHSAFLTDSQVPNTVKRSVAAIQFTNSIDGLTNAGSPLEPVTSVQFYSNDVHIKEKLSPLKDTRVLHFHNLQPNVFGGFVDPAEATDVDRRLQLAFEGSSWCCAAASEGTQWQFAIWNFPVPMAVAARGTVHQVWTPPSYLFERPPLCDSPEMTNETRRFSQQTNHPCKYLSDVPQFTPQASLLVQPDHLHTLVLA